MKTTYSLILLLVSETRWSVVLKQKSANYKNLPRYCNSYFPITLAFNTSNNPAVKSFAFAEDDSVVEANILILASKSCYSEIPK